MMIETAKEIKSKLTDKFIEEIIKMAKDNTGHPRAKVCGIKDELCHKITGFYLDEL